MKVAGWSCYEKTGTCEVKMLNGQPSCMLLESSSAPLLNEDVSEVGAPQTLLGRLCEIFGVGA
jgi:hypothetical protein